MRVRSAGVALVLLAGCGMTEGPLLIALDGGGVASDGGSTMAGAGGSAQPLPPPLIAQDDPWQYQLTGAVDTELDVRLGSLELLEEISGGDFGFNPWLPPGAPDNEGPLALWKEWSGKDLLGELFADYIVIPRGT